MIKIVSAYVPRMQQPFSLRKQIKMSQNAQINIGFLFFFILFNRRKENVVTTNIQQTAAIHLRFSECSVLKQTKNACNPLGTSLINSKTPKIYMFFPFHFQLQIPLHMLCERRQCIFSCAQHTSYSVLIRQRLASVVSLCSQHFQLH